MAPKFMCGYLSITIHEISLEKLSSRDKFGLHLCCKAFTIVWRYPYPGCSNSLQAVDFPRVIAVFFAMATMVLNHSELNLCRKEHTRSDVCLEADF